jgi:hypothetical protein
LFRIGPSRRGEREASLDTLLTRFDCPAALMFKPFDDGQALRRCA